AINEFEQKAILLQHEFKLYGGNHGDNVLRFLEILRAPVVTTLHTVWPSFPSDREVIFGEVLRRSMRLAVFSEISAHILTENYGVAAKKVKVIQHGVPEVTLMHHEWVDLLEITQRAIRFLIYGFNRSG